MQYRNSFLFPLHQNLESAGIAGTGGSLLHLWSLLWRIVALIDCPHQWTVS